MVLWEQEGKSIEIQLCGKVTVELNEERKTL